MSLFPNSDWTEDPKSSVSFSFHMYIPEASQKLELYLEILLLYYISVFAHCTNP